VTPPAGAAVDRPDRQAQRLAEPKRRQRAEADDAASHGDVDAAGREAGRGAVDRRAAGGHTGHGEAPLVWPALIVSVPGVTVAKPVGFVGEGDADAAGRRGRGQRDRAADRAPDAHQRPDRGQTTPLIGVTVTVAVLLRRWDRSASTPSAWRCLV